MNPSRPPANPGRLRARLVLNIGLLPHSAAWLLAALVLFLVTAPWVEGLPHGHVIEPVLLTVVLCAAVLAVGGGRRQLAWALALVLPVLMSRWLQHFSANPLWGRLAVGSYLLFLVFVILRFLDFILRARQVNSEVLCTAVSTYLLLAFLWAAAYTFVARLVPGSFAGLPAASEPLNGFAALYFSIITLTTVGYGDLAPVSAPARMLATLEAITGTMYMAVLVARLVSAYAASANELPPPKEKPPAA